MTRHLTAAAAATAALLAVAAPSAMAQGAQTVDLDSGGATTFKLSKRIAAGFKAAGYSFKTSKGARSAKKGFSFPITGGEMDPVDLRPADIDHRGTLTVRFNRRKATLKNPNLEIGRRSTLSFTIGGRGVTVLNLSMKGARINRQGFESTDAKNIGAKLTKAGAKALNKALKTKGLRGGTRLGTVSTDTRAAEALIDGSAGNKTRLTLNPATAFAFASQNISATALAPATQPTATSFDFPVTGGTIDIASLTGSGPLLGQIQHSGGLKFRDADTGAELDLLNLFFELDTSPGVSVQLGAGRVEAADLDVSAATKAVAGDQVTFNGSIAKVNAAAAAVLQQQFGLPVPPGTTIGTNEVTVTLK